MSSRRRAGAPQLAFEAISIEGGLLSPDWLARVAQLAADHQGTADYRIQKGLNLRDEIGRFWRIAQANHEELVRGVGQKADGATLSAQFVWYVLWEVFGFTSLRPTEPLTREGRIFPLGYAALDRKVPVVIAPAGVGLETSLTVFGDGSHKRSAFGLVQEFLNTADEALWGVVCDGFKLRIVRDNASLTRPAYIEADLARIFREDRYADFAALWLLVHETRFGTADAAPGDCPLEVWRERGRAEGTRARDDLRRGVEEALLALGQGFVAHPQNEPLRRALREKRLQPEGLYQQLLRLAYRLLFLLTVEERNALHAPEAADDARDLYAVGYSLRKLRERSVRRSAHDRYGDLWEGVQIVFRGLTTGESALGLPALGGLFDAAQCPDLDTATLCNSDLLFAVFKLSWLEKAGLVRVNWRDMGPEELGSVYESLLELVPQVDQGTWQFRFAGADEARGNARKTSGSYYTPDTLVQSLLDSALEPVVREAVAAHPADPAAAVARLAVVDPACGSGHFLVAAARRLAGHVARLRAPGTPTAKDYRHALRKVVARCVYGVDLNPMAVELCRLSLWMEAVEPGRPLSFLDAHVRCGNALLGATRDLMAKGVPDEAWEVLEGDDRQTTKELRRRNRAEKKQLLLDIWAEGAASDAIADNAAAIDREPEEHIAEVAAKRAHWDAFLASDVYEHPRFVADLWCAAFVWPKRPGELNEAAPTHGVWERARRRNGTLLAQTKETARQLAAQYGFFHWHLAFAPVFQRGGFDVVLGNPPWEHIESKELEFFASRDARIATATSSAVRKRMIAELPRTNRPLWDEWSDANRQVEGTAHLIRASGRFPLTASGRINTYPLFAEHNRALLGRRGRAGFIVPTGIATDDNTSAFMRALIADHALQQLISFENEGTTFGGVNNRQSFGLLTLSRVPVAKARMQFNVNQPLPDDAGPLDFELAPEDFALFNPNTGNAPTFRTRRDAFINTAMYRKAGILWREEDPDGNVWRVRFQQGLFNMASDSELFRSRTDLEANGWTREENRYRKGEAEMLPLIEAKMVSQFDHRFGTYEGATQAHYNKGFLPRFDDDDHADPHRLVWPDVWIDATYVSAALRDRWNHGWLLGWRDIAIRTNVRTVIASIVPRSAVGHTMPLMFPSASPARIACLYANLCSFALDYAARQKVGGAHLTYGYLKQLPVLPPQTYDGDAPWSRGTALANWLLPRVLELTYTAWDLEAFAADVGYGGPPFRWNAARRAWLRAELDAAFFHLYGLSRDDTAYVMETFPIVKRNDEKEFGDYRTKLRVLEAFDAMAEAARAGQSYATRLSPSPADPKQAHPPRLETPVDLATLPDGAWARPDVDPEGELGALFVALLRVSGKPLPMRLVRLAMVCAWEPRVLTPTLTPADAAQWRRLVGSEATPLPSDTKALVPQVNALWKRVYGHTRASGILAEDLDAQTWGLGPRNAAIETRGWPEGRARQALTWVRALSDHEVRARLGWDLQRWVDEEAAA